MVAQIPLLALLLPGSFSFLLVTRPHYLPCRVSRKSIKTDGLKGGHPHYMTNSVHVPNPVNRCLGLGASSFSYRCRLSCCGVVIGYRYHISIDRITFDTVLSKKSMRYPTLNIWLQRCPRLSQPVLRASRIVLSYRYRYRCRIIETLSRRYIIASLSNDIIEKTRYPTQITYHNPIPSQPVLGASSIVLSYRCRLPCYRVIFVYRYRTIESPISYRYRMTW